MKFTKTNDQTLPRVTHILSTTDSEEDKDRLRKWQHKMDKIHGEGGGDQQRDAAAQRGTAFHEAIQDYISTGYYPEFDDPKEQDRWAAGEQIINQFKPHIYGMEIPVESTSLGYRGTFDAIAFPGSPAIVDWKTSNRYKRREWIENHFLQVTAYAMALEDYAIKAETAHIVIFSPKKCQHFIVTINDHREEWLRRLELFQQLQ